MNGARALLLGAAVAVALIVTAAAAAAPPANDAFDAAAELAGRVANVAATNKDATSETGEPEHAGKVGGASIWYRWTAPAAGRATIDTCDSNFDTLLGVYTGTAVGALHEVAGNDDACGLRSSVSFAAEAGVTYVIAVDGLNGATGEVGLALNLRPPNDDFADGLVLTGDTGTVAGTNEGATNEDADPFGEFTSGSVWYRWTAPTTGPATFETCGSSFDTVVGVFTGSSLADLSFVAGSDDACGSSSRVPFQAVEGVVYHVLVTGYDISVGDFTLVWNRNPPPPELPYALDDPTIAGVARVGHTLVGSAGEWGGTAPFEFAYAWGRCNSDDCVFIQGASAQTYTVTNADVGWHLFLRVTATNVAGSNWAYSYDTPLVTFGAPANTGPPTVSGPPRVGETLFASAGSWNGLAPMQFAYRWQRCDAGGRGCVDLPGEGSSVLVVGNGHAGSTLRVLVTATNVDGSASAASASTTVIPRARQTQARRCVVPNVKRKAVSAARKAIRRGGCTQGRVRRAYSKTVAGGRVISQSPRAGARLRYGAKVNLVLSRGRKR